METVAANRDASQVGRGMILVATAALVVPVLDAISKLLILDHGMSAVAIAFSRLALQVLFALPLLFGSQGLAGLRVERPLLALLRGTALGLAGLFFFAALRFMPLADATAVFFVEPMLVTLMSAALLRERVGARRVAAVVVGFAGALIVIRPSFGVFGFGALLPILAAASLAVYFILSRFLGAHTSALAMHLYSGIGGAVPLGLVMLIAPAFDAPADLLPTWPQSGLALSLILCIGIVGFACHWLFTLGYQMAPASALAPLGYLEIIAAVGLGYALFGELPDAMKFLGIAIIVGSGIFLYWRESVAKRGPEGQAPPVAP